MQLAERRRVRGRRALQGSGDQPQKTLLDPWALRARIWSSCTCSWPSAGTRLARAARRRPPTPKIPTKPLGPAGAQMEQLHVQLAERRRAAGSRRKDAAADPEVRRLEAAITARLRPVTADEEEVAALAANETRYLGLALDNYRRCAQKPKLWVAICLAAVLGSVTLRSWPANTCGGTAPMAMVIVAVFVAVDPATQPCLAGTAQCTESRHAFGRPTGDGSAIWYP